MERDMDLVREILFSIEEKYIDVALYNLQIEGYDQKTIAYHCALLEEGGYISDYKGQYAGNGLCAFGVGRLTWEGHEFLDQIRDDTVWKNTKKTIKEKALPFVFDVVKSISSGILTGMIKSALGG